MALEIGTDAGTGPEYFYSETQQVEVTNGRYNVQIGDDTQFPSDISFPEEIFLCTTVNGETLTPARPSVGRRRDWGAPCPVPRRIRV